jgi:hypothetical protein
MYRRLAAAALLAIALASSALSGEAKHRLAIHVDQNDAQVMNLALNNATNVIEYDRSKNEDVDVDIVTYGPGLHMLRVDTSPVKDRLKRLKRSWLSRATGNIRPVVTPNRAWRKPRARRCRSCPTPRSFPPASSV